MLLILFLTILDNYINNNFILNLICVLLYCFRCTDDDICYVKTSAINMTVFKALLVLLFVSEIKEFKYHNMILSKSVDIRRD